MGGQLQALASFLPVKYMFVCLFTRLVYDAVSPGLVISQLRTFHITWGGEGMILNDIFETM
jgi:hypothetical protein